jgi:hypothetical protein
MYPANTMSLRDLQYEFARHMRDPDNAAPPPGIENRRIGVYRDLLYSNVEAFLATSYPVLRRICNDDRWHALIRDYFRDHRARTPLFPRMPREFLYYLEAERGERPEDFPFLVELAHYEWVETALAIDPREVPPQTELRDDPLPTVPVLSPLAWPLCYRFPVHRIGPEFLPQQPPEQPTYLVVYRNRADQVQFLELNPVAARLVELLQHNQHGSGRELIQRIADELPNSDPDATLAGGRETLIGLRDRDIVL